MCNCGWAETLRLGPQEFDAQQQQQSPTIYYILYLCTKNVSTKSLFLWDTLMSPPGRFLPAVPWASPGWRTPAAKSSSRPAAPLPAGSSSHRAQSFRSGGLWFGPGRSCRSGSSPIGLWCQSGGRENNHDWYMMTISYKQNVRTRWIYLLLPTLGSTLQHH